MTDSAQDSAKPTRDTPWAIKMIHGLAADRVRQRLGADAFVLAVVLIERLDGILSKRLGHYMSQLAEACGDSIQNPRRTRLARTALIEDGWLIADLPKNGERSQGFYQMVLKTTPTKSVVGIHATPDENGLGEVDPNQNGSVTPTKSVVSPQPKPTAHPNQNGSPSVPILSTPILPDPILSIPNAPEGACDEHEVFSLTASADKPAKPPRKQTSKNNPPVDSRADAIFQEYPRRVSKQDGLIAITKALGKIAFDDLLVAVKLYAAHRKFADPGNQHTPYPATWMNDERWTDDRSEWVTSQALTGISRPRGQPPCEPSILGTIKNMTDKRIPKGEIDREQHFESRRI